MLQTWHPFLWSNNYGNGLFCAEWNNSWYDSFLSMATKYDVFMHANVMKGFFLQSRSGLSLRRDRTLVTIMHISAVWPYFGWQKGNSPDVVSFKITLSNDEYLWCVLDIFLPARGRCLFTRTHWRTKTLICIRLYHISTRIIWFTNKTARCHAATINCWKYTVCKPVDMLAATYWTNGVSYQSARGRCRMPSQAIRRVSDLASKDWSATVQIVAVAAVEIPTAEDSDGVPCPLAPFSLQ